MNPSGKLVAARYPDGRVVKGPCWDFRPTRAHFHVQVEGEEQPVRVDLADLKALFFIKSLEGDARHEERKAFAHASGVWHKTWIVFACDGEELAGWSTGSLSSKFGFFFVPADTESNLERAYVLHSALKSVRKGADAEAAAREYAKKNAGRPRGPGARRPAPAAPPSGSQEAPPAAARPGSSPEPSNWNFWSPDYRHNAAIIQKLLDE